MTFLVFSDSHGSTYSIDTAMEREAKVSGIIFCGDIARDADTIRERYPAIPLYAVCGNNDYFCSDPFLLIAELGGIRTYITHGHKERVKFGLYELASHCEQQNCRLALFGHTHTPCVEYIGEVCLVNPGSIRSSHGSYARIVVKNDDFSAEIVHLDEPIHENHSRPC